MSSTKYILVILSGLGSDPLDACNGKTPLELATTPALDSVSEAGRLGVAATADPGAFYSAELGLLTLLGYNTTRFPIAPGPLDAAGLGVALDRRDLALRLDFISTYNDQLMDLCAGQIQRAEAEVLIKMLNLRLGGESICFYPGLGYRNLLVMTGQAALDMRTHAPLEALDGSVEDYRPTGRDSGVLIDLMQKGRRELENHDVNKVRVDLGENPADAIWPWGEGIDFTLPAFENFFPLKGSLVGAMPWVRGIARKIGFDVIDVPGVTGDAGTNFSGKVAAVLEALQRYDLVVLHVGATFEFKNRGDPVAAIAATETVDCEVLAPLLDGLQSLERWRLMVASDQPASMLESSELYGLIPVAFCGHRVEGIRHYDFTEANAMQSDLIVKEGHNLIEFFLGIQRWS